MYIYLRISLSAVYICIYVFTIYLSVLSTYLHLSFKSIYLYTYLYLFINLPSYLFTRLSICCDCQAIKTSISLQSVILTLSSAFLY